MQFPVQLQPHAHPHQLPGVPCPHVCFATHAPLKSLTLPKRHARRQLSEEIRVGSSPLCLLCHKPTTQRALEAPCTKSPGDPCFLQELAQLLLRQAVAAVGKVA